ncbi:Erp family protein (plasmid) [Borreliella afzelii PKo]|uniref:Erp family protein n=1 Tax=Borreliella afzelii (strain PKo) TaxID=390236 RepID=G0ISR2_BORAP|nr:Erp family protein [Borreliella afzelii PKo]
MNKKMFIICAIFSLIISCKNYADSKQAIKRKVEQGLEIERKNKQELKKQVKGFLDTKERIVSDDPTVYEIAEKLKEEELKGKKENKEDVNLENKGEKEDSNKNDLKDNEDAKVLKPEPKPIALENKEPKLERSEILKPELPEMPKLPVVSVVVKPVVKEKTEEEKARDKEYEDLRRRRIEQYQKQEEERLKRKAEREERKKLRESSGTFLERATKGKISTVVKQIDKIISDINSINPGSSFEERMVVSGKEVEDKVTGAIYDDITDNRSNGNSIYSEWSDDLEEESGLKKLIDELEKARTELRGKIKEGKDNNEKNKNTVIISDIKGDLEKLKEFLRKLKEYLQSNANKEEIQKLVKCSIDPYSDGCQ